MVKLRPRFELVSGLILFSFATGVFGWGGMLATGTLSSHLILRQRENPKLGELGSAAKLVFSYQMGESRGAIEIKDYDGLFSLAVIQAHLLTHIAVQIASSEEKENVEALRRAPVRGWELTKNEYLYNLNRVRSVYASSAKNDEPGGAQKYFEGRVQEIDNLILVARGRVTYADLDEVGKWLRTYAHRHSYEVETREPDDRYFEQDDQTHLFEIPKGENPSVPKAVRLFSKIPLTYEEASSPATQFVPLYFANTIQVGNDEKKPK